MSEYTPTTGNVRSVYAYGGAGQSEDRRREQFDRWLAAHDREIESRLVNNLEVMGDYLVVRGAHEAEYPAGPEYGPYPGSDAEPIAPIDQIAGMKDYLAAHDRAVKAEAWEECSDEFCKQGIVQVPANPYAEEADHDHS